MRISESPLFIKMMLIWFILKDKGQIEGLKILQKKHYPNALKLPHYRESHITFNCIESVEEIDKIMREKPKQVVQ